MELPSSFTSSAAHIHSFSSSFTPNPIQIFIKIQNPTSKTLHISAAAVDPPQRQISRRSPQRLLKELAERKRNISQKKRAPRRRFILTPPLDDTRIANRYLNSPQLALNSFPLLSSCLPYTRLTLADKAWIEEYLLEAKQALGYPLEPSETLGDDNPAKELDTLLYLAFQHPTCERARARHVRCGHSRLFFLGQYVLELAFTEFFLLSYPRESPAAMRERVFGLIGKRNLPRWIKAASLDNLIFPYDEMDKLVRKEREPPVK